MERPILFSGPMVRAILDGRKTVTRRIMKPQPTGTAGKSWPDEDRWAWPSNLARTMVDINEARGLCPFGSSGDRLWVRETWMPRAAPCGVESFSNGVIYAATPNAGGGYAVHARESHADQIARLSKPGFTWRPSIHMPRWASRLTLEVVGVRVERLQEITEEDAIAEGAQRFDNLPSTHPYGQDARWSMEAPTATDQCLGSARMAFANLWDKLNSSRAPWASNPWVWRVEFRRVQP